MNDCKKIVHVMMESPFLIGYGYQENILTVKHKELGYDVSVVSTRLGIANQIDAMDMPDECTTEDGIKIYYLDVNHSILRKIPFIVGWTKASKHLYDKLVALAPDIIFLHGICKIDNMDVIKYCKKKPGTKLFADNHSDYFNTPVNTIQQKSFRYCVGRYVGRFLNKYATRVWGVTPWRVTYQQEVYGIRKEKSALLVMGGDEAHINWNHREEVRESIRQRLSIPKDAFAIATGGRIDKSKNIHLMIKAMEMQNMGNIHMIIFGKFSEDMKEYQEAIKNNPRIHYIGWISPTEANDYFLASDLACFPGTHSVLWEQACACGIPAVFKDWDGGFSHVDVGGNCVLLKDISADTLYHTIHELASNATTYQKMKEMSETKARKIFSYIEIAKRSIEIN